MQREAAVRSLLVVVPDVDAQQPRQMAPAQHQRPVQALHAEAPHPLGPLLGPLPSLDLAGIDWVIVGGESGPGYRPLELDWVRQIRDRCVELGIPLFFKQVGGRTPKAGGRLLDGRTWDQFPAVVQAPAVPVAGGQAGA